MELLAKQFIKNLKNNPFVIGSRYIKHGKNKTNFYRFLLSYLGNKFIKTFKEGQVDFIGKNIDTFGSKILQIDNLVDLKKDNIDFNINDTMNLSPQEAQQELNLVEQEIDQLSYNQLLEQLNFS